jgi:hypothetical protein
MKNPFNKRKNTTLWIGWAVACALTATAVTCLYLHRKRAEALIAGHTDHDQDYLAAKHNKMKKKKNKTDVHDLENIVKHTLV